MIDQKAKLIVGSLLHDIGKVIYRQGGDGRNHSVSGWDYLKEETQISDQEVLDCVRYHHAALLRNARLADDHIAYIVYIADNIAAFADRREREETDERGFELSVPLQSVFNILNGNHQDCYYHPGDMNPENGINYPTKEKVSFTQEFYQKIRQNLTENLKGDWSEEYVNSLISVMEANLTYVPSSTAKAELTDISLFDHVKFTAAVASCIYDYMNEKQLNYKTTLFTREKEFYDQKSFLLCSLDISGIQKFIYTITSKNALRTLRARSFYLEIMMEHMIDMLLEALDLSRANLIYSGGGHCYLLLANTSSTAKKITMWQQKIKQWLLEQFQIELYVACGYVECSANDLRNVPEGSYSELFHKLSEQISHEKLHRYNAEEIISLNHRKADDYTRECKVCKRIGKVDEEGQCTLCSTIQNFSKNVLEGKFFSVVLQEEGKGLPLPGGYLLRTDTEKTLKERMEHDPFFVRAYSKNEMYAGKHITTKLWVGDYTTGNTFEEFAEAAEGIKRIGILRADVDNLGQTIVSGFSGKYATLTRTAVLSRQLSAFFKYYIRFILENGSYRIDGQERLEKRKATIVYSGGDDVFIVGAWNDIIELSLDLEEKFRKYTQGTLSMSAGIGVYECSYPIAAIADETGQMEAESKKMPKKASVTLMSDGETHLEKDVCTNEIKEIGDGTYTWKEFRQKVIEEKYHTLQEFFGEIDERGMSFLYRMLELIRQQKADRINFARFVYLLSRLEPKNDGSKKESYRRFSQKMYQWIQSEQDCRQLKTAINLYAYMHRDKGERENENY